VTVFEALPVAGGMLRVGIPEYHLPKEILDREIAFIESCGVEIKTNMRLGDTLTITTLEQFDAVFIATGAHKANIPDISGIDLNSVSVLTAVDFLKRVALNKTISLGNRVLVVGGGDVALDCVRSARRLGVPEIKLACLEKLDQMPASAERIAQAKEEGLDIHPSCLVCKVLKEDGRCTGVECLALRSMEFREDGSLHVDPLENSEHVIPVDTILLAAGQTIDPSIFPKGLKVNRGRIAVDENGATTLPKYFAGGDAATPQKTVAHAVGFGRRAAEAIDRYLPKLPESGLIPSVTMRKSEIQNPDIFEKKERSPIPKLNIAERLSSFAEVELGLGEEEAKKEAGRCLECRGMCGVVCPYDAPQFGTGDNPKMQMCNSCLEDWSNGKKPMCVRSCPVRALDFGPIGELQAKYGEVRVARRFTYSEKNRPSVIFKTKERRTVI
jgi:NADH-quinone oxidoreductase subunit F